MLDSSPNNFTPQHVVQVADDNSLYNIDMSTTASVDSLLQQVKYQFPGRVRSDVNSLLSRTRALRPQVGTFVHNDGAVSRLLLLSGTFPIQYLGTQYNIPVDIYLLEAYPEAPPVLYVRPTPNMLVKPNHRYVDPNGLIRVPYVSAEAWRASTSTLPALIDEMSAIYSREPPLFTKPPGYVPPTSSSSSSGSGSSGVSMGVAAATPAPTTSTSTRPPPPPYVLTSSSGMGDSTGSLRSLPSPYYPPAPANSAANTPHSTSTMGGGGGGFGGSSVYGYGSISRSSSATSVGSTYNNTSSSSSTSNPNPTTSYGANTSTSTSTSNTTPARETYASRREELNALVTSKLQHSLHTFYSKVRDEIDEEFQMQTKLESRHTAAQARAGELKRLASDLDRERERTAAARSALQKWADEMKSARPVSAEERVTAFDAATAQLVALQAAVASTDDALYFAERSLANRANVAASKGYSNSSTTSSSGVGGGGIPASTSNGNLSSGGVPSSNSNDSLSPASGPMDVNTYMREVRRLSRQQFLDRRHISKIQEAIRAEMQ